MSSTRKTSAPRHNNGDEEPLAATTNTAPGTDTRTGATTASQTTPPRETEPYYPDIDMPFARTVPELYERFAQIREDICLDYNYNTARAYWADLDDLLYWAIQRDKDPLHLTDKDLTQYIALHRRRHYSENTIRRRLVVIRKLQRRVSETEQSQK